MPETITRNDLIELATYRKGREEYLKKMIAYKKKRRIKLGEHISLLFENRNTVLFQIQELVNSEDLTDPVELDEYIEIYSGMLPGDDELSATLFIELDEQQKLTDLLVNLKGIEHYLTLTIGEEKVKAVFEEEHNDRELTTSVHYLKFPLTLYAKELLNKIDSASNDAVLELHHPNLSVSSILPLECVRSLQSDLV